MLVPSLELYLMVLADTTTFEIEYFLNIQNCSPRRYDSQTLIHYLYKHQTDDDKSGFGRLFLLETSCIHLGSLLY
jgi:hypothetical protein